MTTPLNTARLAIGIAASVVAITAVPHAALADEELDLYAENAWVVDQTGAEAAWETTTGEGVTVAVVDTGIAEEHPFLEDKSILDGKSFMGDDEANARVDTDGHGTGVSAAVLFAAPEATILPVRVGSTSADIGFGTGVTQIDIDGIRWAADNAADVIVIPWGEVTQAEPNPEFLEVVQYAIDKDAVVIAAGGNDPELDQVPNPASFPGVVAVSGTDRSGDAWSTSTTGPQITLAGPADTMLFPIPQIADFGDEDLYFEAAGTSAAAGVVAGVAALVRAAHPDLDASNVLQRLIATADDHGQARTDTLGFGAIDADRAVNATDVETVTENPLGYPLGSAGASDASEDPASSEEGSAAPATTGEPAAAGTDSGQDELMPVVLTAAVVVLLAAAVSVWLVLRSRQRKTVQPWQ
ncbi:hypothetical protein GCM10009830_24530 [Glycomyces endophyticus]|uniref:Peptidase S8/S53 domain-containing protein n=1 Tax=Glycomyces endophyticus TaxID=480996 RepID=A0ABN2GU41_9ACTN